MNRKTDIKAAVIIKLQFKISKILKFIDAFSGTPIDGAKAKLLLAGLEFLNKAGGFYVISNIENGAYTVKITMTGYCDKEVQLIINGSEDIQFISLIPVFGNNGIGLCGTLSVEGEPVANQRFYYTIICEDYSRIITGGSMQNDLFSVQVYDENSLEGRNFAFYDRNEVYTFGKYDYNNQKYKVENCDSVPVYQNIFLLFEESTDKNGNFSFYIPKHIVRGDSMELLFFTESTNGSQIAFYPFDKNLNVCLEKG